MDITRIGQYTQPLTQTPRQQPATGTPVALQVQPKATTAPASQAPATQPKAGTQAPAVQARDLLSEDERSYLEMLFPGATAIDTYGGKGKTPAPPTGSIVDRKG